MRKYHFYPLRKSDNRNPYEPLLNAIKDAVQTPQFIPQGEHPWVVLAKSISQAIKVQDPLTELIVLQPGIIMQYWLPNKMVLVTLTFQQHKPVQIGLHRLEKDRKDPEFNGKL